MLIYYVELLKTKATGDQEVVAICYLDPDSGNEIVRIETESEGLRELLSSGIVGRRIGKRLYPKDGLEFLKELRFAFTGSMLRATEMRKKEG